MKRSLVAATFLVGLWAAVAPLLLSWGVSLTIFAVNIVPGTFTVVLAAVACSLRADVGAPALDRQLLVDTCSYFVMLGAWMLLGPFLFGYPLTKGHASLGAMLPGAVVMGLALANGYLGWREANPS